MGKLNRPYRANKTFKHGWKCVRVGAPRPKPHPSAWDSSDGCWRISYSGHIRRSQRHHYGRRWALWNTGGLVKRIPRHVKTTTIHAASLRNLQQVFNETLGRDFPVKVGTRKGWEKWRMDGDILLMPPDPKSPYFVKYETSIGEWQVWKTDSHRCVAASSRLKGLYINYLTGRLEGKA